MHLSFLLSCSWPIAGRDGASCESREPSPRKGVDFCSKESILTCTIKSHLQTYFRSLVHSNAGLRGGSSSTCTAALKRSSGARARAFERPSSRVEVRSCPSSSTCFSLISFPPHPLKHQNTLLHNGTLQLQLHSRQPPALPACLGRQPQLRRPSAYHAGVEGAGFYLLGR